MGGKGSGGAGGISSDEGTKTLVLYVYYNHFTPTTLSPFSLQYNEHKRIAFVPHVPKYDSHRASIFCLAALVFLMLLTENGFTLNKKYHTKAC